MIPIFKRLRDERASSGVIVKEREPDQPAKEEPSAALEACGQDLINAIKAGDAKAAAQALYDAFEIADSEPHVEGEHIQPHSYDASKE